MRVRVRDQGIPYKSVSTTVLVNVQRNFEEPRFGESRYRPSVPESASIGTSIEQVVATDADRQVSLVVNHCVCVIN